MPFSKSSNCRAAESETVVYEPDGLAYREWLDTRTIPFPGERDRTCDTVARLDRAGHQAEPVRS
jgi:hypothetical protein